MLTVQHANFCVSRKKNRLLPCYTRKPGTLATVTKQYAWLKVCLCKRAL